MGLLLIHHRSVCIMVALIIRGAFDVPWFDVLPGMFGEGKARAQPTRECPQRSAGKIGAPGERSHIPLPTSRHFLNG